MNKQNHKSTGNFFLQTVIMLLMILVTLHLHTSKQQQQIPKIPKSVQDRYNNYKNERKMILYEYAQIYSSKTLCKIFKCGRSQIANAKKSVKLGVPPKKTKLGKVIVMYFLIVSSTKQQIQKLK